MADNEIVELDDNSVSEELVEEMIGECEDEQMGDEEEEEDNEEMMEDGNIEGNFEEEEMEEVDEYPENEEHEMGEMEEEEEQVEDEEEDVEGGGEEREEIEEGGDNEEKNEDDDCDDDDDDDICIVEENLGRDGDKGEDVSQDSDYKENKPENVKDVPKTEMVEDGDGDGENKDKSREKGKDEKSSKLVPVEETDIPDEETGFPNFMRDYVLRGKCIPINKKTWMDINIDGNDAILDCASQVVPLMIKKASLFPPKLKKEEDENENGIEGEESEGERDRQEENKDKEDIKEKGKEKDGNEDEEEGEEEGVVKEKDEKAKKSTMLTIPDYYTSSIGTFLMSIGLSRVKQWYHKDAIKQVHKLIRKEGEADDLIEEIKNQQAYYNQCKTANSAFIFKLNQCHMCEFKTESQLVMEGHLSVPHLSNRKEFKCNYCTFLTRDPRAIIFHFQNIHKKPCHIEVPPPLYECPICHYESSQKQKAANHITKCLKLFNPDKVSFVPDPECEYSSITPKPITQEDIKVYEATLQALRPAALNPQGQLPNIPGLPRGLQQQMFAMQQQQLAQQQRNIRSGRGFGRQVVGRNNGNFGKSTAPQLYHMLQSGGITLQNQNSRIPIQGMNYHSQVVKGRVVPGSNNAVMMHKNQGLGKAMLGGGKGGNGGKDGKSGTFVICEICDGYIKDLEQLRTHMQWIHKVKIHPKMLASRPPLNCQKCQWRFFTDQGLERHLLGAHGLVTSNMQDMVDQNQDSGRCTICGRVFANKLVAHMNQVHKITLRPAHLSYKCTVCSATFNLYRLFENHVYMVHSGSVKRNSEDSALHLNKRQRSFDHKSNERALGARSRISDPTVVLGTSNNHVRVK